MWSADFIAALSVRPSSWVYWVDTIQTGDTGAPFPFRVWSAASHAYLGAMDRLDIGLTMQGAAVSPATIDSGWSGSFSVLVVGNLENARTSLTRGTMLRVRCGPAGWSETSLQVIAFGVITGISVTGRALLIQCADAISSLMQRSSLNGGSQALFYSIAGADTTLTANEAVASATYDVGSTAFFQKSPAAGAFLVTPTTGDPYYRIWSASTGTTLTISSPGTASVMGTTDVGASSGDRIRGVAYLNGHPLDIVRRIILSNGAVVGSYNLLPNDWGLGFPEWTLDHADINAWRDTVMLGAANMQMRMAQAEQVDDVLGFLTEILSGFGAALCMRQGLITMRAVQLSSTVDYVGPSDFEITDADIGSIESHEWFDSQSGVEYGEVAVSSATQATVLSGDDTTTLPAAQRYSIDLSDRVFDNESAVTTNIASRRSEGLRRVPERIVIVSPGMRLAQLAPLDRPMLTSRLLTARTATGGVFDRSRVVIDEVSPDWSAGLVRVGILSYPQEAPWTA